jgi:Flp pilus assembly protein TadG
MLTGWAGMHCRRRSEQGAVAVMVAISLTALLVVTGIVLDFGLARTDKVTNKGYTDSAAAAGVRSLDAGDGTFKPFRGACTALSYLKVSDPEVATMAGFWTDGNGAAVGSDPCQTGSPRQGANCTANTPATWAAYQGSAGRIQVDIKSGYTTPDPTFPTDGPADNGVSVNGGCDQIAVILREVEHPGLGKIASGRDIVTRSRTVGRMTAASGGDASAALLILERIACPAVSVNSINTFIQVKGFGDKPGVIHSDSDGSDPACLPANPAILGKFAGPPGISARQSETGTPRLPGQITTVAGAGLAGSVPANATDGATKVCAETALPLTSSVNLATSCVPATGRALVGRGPVDRRYLTGVRAAMASARSEYTKSASAAAAGYTVIGGSSAACKNQNAVNTQGPAIFVDCPGGINYKDYTFANATTVVYNGDVSVNPTNTLSMPNVTRLYVNGSTTTGGGLTSSGTLNVNTGGSAACPSSRPASARIVVGTGQFSGGAQSAFHLCQTTVLMANDQPAGACPLPATASPGTGSAPYDNPCNGYVDVNAGGAMDWTAPNRKPTGPAVQLDWDNLEDLALWTEASHVSSIGGGASMNITGVFFLPNANPFIISGHGNQTIAANAQFVARKLQVQGQGTLYMRPDPNDSFTLPLFLATFNLVR